MTKATFMALVAMVGFVFAGLGVGTGLELQCPWLLAGPYVTFTFGNSLGALLYSVFGSPPERQK